MKKIFVINGGQVFAHSGGFLNKQITTWDEEYFTPENGFELRITDINQPYDAQQEVDNFVWADIIVYHFPVWWFSLPSGLKKYLDEVLTAGHRKGLYYSDGRKMDNPEINYGTGGSLHGKQYMVTTSWNAPATAFTLEGEFFGQKSVDEGVLFGFHRMNAFLALTPLKSIHFHDVEKNMNAERLDQFKQTYLQHLTATIAQELLIVDL
ncbi:NAD(P)H-dependent oxidoreductase [Solitalea sp. MAHUQ-68]|uniref:NAD(P)H-dependent oxidoreductase n=1 Tax=Solitalea agri TaxID=2953739 RepID=A0A9X2F4Q5_9SPHI|nr:NAD(P)H-dependent oxidoreductase [Solitalea agri]MCO4294261.1 NAD(P)H-dependent oxidoreductase [Solitalea agri]